MRTTEPDKAAPCPLDRVNHVFKAQRPNQLWVSDFTYVSTWQGWLYVAFVIDVFSPARRGLAREQHHADGVPEDRGTRSAVADNMLDRQFRADGPNQKWVADFTYIWTAEGWLYVAAVLALYSRRIVG